MSINRPRRVAGHQRSSCLLAPPSSTACNLLPVHSKLFRTCVYIFHSAHHLHLLSILRPVVAALLLISSPPSEGSPLSPAANKPSLSCALQHPDCRLPPPRSGEFKRMHFCIVNKNTYNLMCRAWQDYHFFACPDAEIFIWSAGLSPIFHKFIYRVKPR